MVLLGSADFKYKVSGTDWGNLPEGWCYGEATSVASDSKDNIYVFNRGHHPMIVLSQNGDFVRSWGEGMFSNPHGIAIGPDDSVYCVDNGDHTISKFSPEGEFLLRIGEQNKPAKPLSGIPFSQPTHIAVDPNNGDLYVSDGYENAQVHKYSSSGKLLLSWGESGTDEGQFSLPHNIDTDSNGMVYVADRENQRIQIFDPDGNFQYQMGLNIARPGAVCIKENNGQLLVYVGEFFSGFMTYAKAERIGPRISILDQEGKKLANVGYQSFGDDPGQFYSPHAIAVDSRGDIYVAEVSLTEKYGGIVSPPEQGTQRRSFQKLIKQ
jgi:DNA-binding beta-propeller fold protein YncE